MIDYPLFVVTFVFMNLGGILLLYYTLTRYCKNINEIRRTLFPNCFYASFRPNDSPPLYEDLSFHEDMPPNDNPPSYEEAVKLMIETSRAISALQDKCLSSFNYLLESTKIKVKCKDNNKRLDYEEII